MWDLYKSQNMTACWNSRGLIAFHSGRNNEGLCTYASNFFKKSTVAPEVDELLIEEPGELELQRWIVADLTGKDDALPHGDIQRGWQGGDDGRFWNTHSHPSNNFDQTHWSAPLFPALWFSTGNSFSKKPSPSIILMDMSDSVNRGIYGTEHTAK